MYDHNEKPGISPRDTRTYSELIGEFILCKLDEYAKLGREHGHFVMSCLENDLCKSCAHADGGNINKILAIAKYLYCQLPAPCWGSKSKVLAWSELGGEKGWQANGYSALKAKTAGECGCIGHGWDIFISDEHGAQIQKCDDCSPHRHDDDVWKEAIQSIRDGAGLLSLYTSATSLPNKG